MSALIALSASSLARQNSLLAALPDADFERLARDLEPSAMSLGEILYEPGTRLRRLHFPTTAVVSLHHVLESGASAESAGVGFEGLVGISLFMGGDTTPSSATVQIAGNGYTLDPVILKREFARAGAVQRLLLGYTQLLIAQMTQTAACNRHHTVEQQICRWLLMTLDRVGPREIVVTQEMMAAVLGVRRESVTEVAGDLQRSGVISYRRGHISVLHREGLDSRVCECYAAIRSRMQRPKAELPVAKQLCVAAPRRGRKPGVQCATEFSADHLNIRSNTHMNKDRIEGTVRQAVGTVKVAAGKVLKDSELQSEGKIEKAVGKVQTAVGGVREALKKSGDSPR